jgi:hypothetical protein
MTNEPTERTDDEAPAPFTDELRDEALDRLEKPAYRCPATAVPSSI